MPVLTKINQLRQHIHSAELKKTGRNTFSKYNYFELADFLVPALKQCFELNLSAVVSFTADLATMTVTDLDDGTQFLITSPMSSASLKACHEVQNLGAVQTYLRRYLWVALLEIVEHDAIDSSAGPVEKSAKKPDAGGVISGPSVIFSSLPEDWQSYLKTLAPKVENTFEQLGASAAQELIASEDLDNDCRAGLESLLPSKVRSALKKANAPQKEAA